MDGGQETPWGLGVGDWQGRALLRVAGTRERDAGIRGPKRGGRREVGGGLRRMEGERGAPPQAGSLMEGPHLTCSAPASCPRRRRSAAQPEPCPPNASCASGGSRRPAPGRSRRRKASPGRRGAPAPRRPAPSASSSRGRPGRPPSAAGLVRASRAAVAAAAGDAAAAAAGSPPPLTFQLWSPQPATERGGQSAPSSRRPPRPAPSRHPECPAPTGSHPGRGRM